MLYGNDDFSEERSTGGQAVKNWLFITDLLCLSFEMLCLLSYVEKSQEQNAKYFLLSAEKHPVYSNKLYCKYYATEPIRISSLA